MNDWVRRAGSVLVSGLEVLLALAMLFSVWILLDVQAGVESGAYDREAASGFVIGFFALWLLASLGMVAVAGSHAVVRSILVADDDGPGALRDGLVRVGVELLLSFVLYVGVVGTGAPFGAFSLVLGATAVVAIGLLVHVAVDAVRFARGLATAG